MNLEFLSRTSISYGTCDSSCSGCLKMKIIFEVFDNKINVLISVLMLNPSKSESYPHSLMHFFHCHIIESKNSRLIGHHISCRGILTLLITAVFCIKLCANENVLLSLSNFQKLDLTSIQYENFNEEYEDFCPGIHCFLHFCCVSFSIYRLSGC